jgi:ubiquinone/menaquinone biosynthesis C-methylase UbiE
MLYPLSYEGRPLDDTARVCRVSTPRAVDDQLAIVDTELQNALIGTTKWNESRIPVIRGTFARLLNHVTLLTAADTDKPILEIGCDGKLASSKVLHGLTGLDVIASNLTISGMDQNIGDYPITLKQNDVGALNFPDDSFSMLFGRAVLEHISDMDDFLAECDRVLEPGGVLYLDGGPLFYSPRGHHMAVKGPSGTHYGFDGMRDLLPNWCQLESNEEEVFLHLTELKGIDAADARVVANYVFTSPEQNRMSATMVMDTFARSPFSNLKHEPMHVKKIVPPPHLVEKYGEFDLTCNGLAYFGTSGPPQTGPTPPSRPLWRRIGSRVKRIFS